MPVSVVIPAYNAERFIGEALESVRAQTVRPSEVIVVDDGSTDATARIAAEWGARVIRQPNGRAAAARNTGISASASEWVAFLDADDLWTADKLEAQCEVVRTQPQVGFVFTDHAQFDAEGVKVPSMFHWRPNYQAIRRQEVSPGISIFDTDSLVEGFLEGNFLVPSTWLVRRSVLDEAGPLDPALGGYCEDREYCLRLLCVTSAAAVERPLMRLRLRPGSVSSNAASMHLGRAMVAERVLAHPERYPPRSLAHARENRALELKRAGRQFLMDGRCWAARAVLLRSLQARPSVRTLVLLALALAGKRTCRRVLASREPHAR